MRAIFDSHPQLVVYPEETVFFRRFWPESTGLDLENQLKLAEQKIIHIFDWSQESPPPSQTGFPDRDYTSISFEEIRQVMQELVQKDHRHPGDILSAAVLAFGQVCEQINPETRCWVEKSPYNEYFTEQIFTWWPDARCIHVLRDPRDNYISYQRKHPDWSAEFLAANWTRSTRAGLENRDRYGAQRYRLLRYEDLTQTPETVIPGLADFLDIDWDISLTAPTRAGDFWAGNSMFADQFQGISVTPVARWKENLQPRDAAVIELMTASLLDIFQYSQDLVIKRHPAQALAARWRVTTWPIRKRLRRQWSKRLAAE